MSPGQTGHITGQMGRVPGTDGTHTRGRPAKILCVYWFFSFPWKVPRLPRKFPELPRKFSATSPEVLSLWNWRAIQRFPGSFPDFPGSFPDFPGGSPDFPEVPRTSPEVPRTSPEVSRFSGKPDTLFWLTKTFSEFCHKMALRKAILGPS